MGGAEEALVFQCCGEVDLVGLLDVGGWFCYSLGDPGAYLLGRSLVSGSALSLSLFSRLYLFRMEYQILLSHRSVSHMYSTGLYKTELSTYKLRTKWPVFPERCKTSSFLRPNHPAQSPLFRSAHPSL